MKISITVLGAILLTAYSAVSLGSPKPVAGWAELCDAASVAKRVQPFQGAARAAFVAPGTVRLPTCFVGERNLRAAWDIRLNADMESAQAILFDFRCDDLASFSNFAVYFKSGGGWYSATFSPANTGCWARVRLACEDFRVEGRPSGWRAISVVRFAGNKTRECESSFQVRDLSFEDGEMVADALVIRADRPCVSAEKNNDGGRRYYTDRTVASLKRCGVTLVTLADTAVKPAFLKGRRFVVLPFNTSISSELSAMLTDYVAHGGKLLVFYSLAPDVAKLLHVKNMGFRAAKKLGAESFDGMSRFGKGLDGQPPMARQQSRNAMAVKPDEDCEVVAMWCLGEKETELPAVVKSPNGIYVSHVWMGNNAEDCEALLRSIVATMMPEGWLKSRLDEVRLATERTRAANRQAAAFLAQEQPEEFRGFWCHNAYGLPGRSWDESVKMLKDKGFTAVLPNVAWGGAASYKSSVLKEVPDVAKKGDALEECLKACRKYGLACHPWKVCWKMGRWMPNEIAAEIAQNRGTQVAVDGKEEEGWLCPSDPINQKLEIDAFVELAGKGVDGVHLDYIRYPDASHCFCAGCRTRFEAFVGVKMKNWPHAVRGNGPFVTEWHNFRRRNIDAVVEGVWRGVRAKGVSVKISAAVREPVAAAAINDGQDWVKWAKKGFLDFVCPMDYTQSPAVFRRLILSQREAVGACAALYPGIGLSCWKSDCSVGDVFKEMVKIMREENFRGWTVFNYDSRAVHTLWE